MVYRACFLVEFYDLAAADVDSAPIFAFISVFLPCYG